MKFVVLAQGKLKDRNLRAVSDDYLTRLRRYVPVSEIEVKDASALARRIPGDALVVMLEVQGELLSSRTLASRIDGWMLSGKSSLCFVIGGAEGIPERLSKSGDVQLSLSRLTLPHRLVRVLLFEQLYRAMTILRGEPYARED